MTISYVSIPVASIGTMLTIHTQRGFENLESSPCSSFCFLSLSVSQSPWVSFTDKSRPRKKMCYSRSPIAVFFFLVTLPHLGIPVTQNFIESELYQRDGIDY